MREVARDKSRAGELLPDVLGFKIILALFNFLVIVALTLPLPKPGWMKTLILLAGAEAMLTWIAYVFVNIMHAHEVTKYEALARTIERTRRFLLAVWSSTFIPLMSIRHRKSPPR